ncbi:MAG: hypothetical protein EP335_08095 [Alphaproteobacteria bacterium]|nr:MAG: hypothetical protein EP335_08095 [Alphaproteobacteria bacterium]
MKAALPLLLTGILTACATAGSQAPRARAEAMLGQLAPLPADTAVGDACVLEVGRGADILLRQSAPGADARVQGPLGQETLPPVGATDGGFGPYARTQQFANSHMDVLLSLNPADATALSAPGMLKVSTQGGMQAILPIVARITCPETIHPS